MTIWQRWKQTSLHNKALVLSSILMAFGTLFYTGAAVVQIKLFNKSSREAAQQTEKLIAAANINASAAQKNAAAAESFSSSAAKINSGIADAVTKLQTQAEKMDAARASAAIDSSKALQATIDSSHLEERAWIGECGDGVESFEKDKPIRVFIRFCNSGRTPAYQIQESMMWTVSPIPIEAPGDKNWNELQYIPGNAVAPQGGFDLHAGGSGAGTLRSPMQDQGARLLDSKYNDVLAGTSILYFYGRIKYSDAFGNERHTEFCIVLANPQAKELQFCQKHNNLD